MIIITAVGRDQPGMVAAISQKILEASCNIEDATMTRLSGEFAMILVVANPPSLNAAALQQQLASLQETHALRLSCNNLDNSQQEEAAEILPSRYVLSAYGPDRTGLVARVAGVLAAQGANITDLQTRVASRHALYVMIFELEFPPILDVEKLREALNQAARELNVEVTLREREEDTL